MELFVFLRMGGKQDQMSFIKIVDDAKDLFARFDAGKAQCGFGRDRETLLAVIEAGFGDLHPFNKLVRRISTTETWIDMELTAVARRSRANSRRVPIHGTTASANAVAT